MLARAIARFVAAPAIAAFLIAGCGTGVTKPSTSAIAEKLSSESELAAVKKSVGSKYETFIDCVATSLHDNGKAADLKEYVSGKRGLNEVRVSSSDKKTIDSQIVNCVKNIGITPS